MADLEITCVNKRDRTDPTDRITHVGGAGWKKTSEDAIRDIEYRIHTFHVRRGANRVEVDVAVSARGNKYLKTRPDNETSNNLLSLPECR